MNQTDVLLLWLIAILGIAAALMRMSLRKKQGKPMSLLWKVQSLVFPALVILALALYMTGTADAVTQLILAALAQEIVFGILRRRKENGFSK